MNEKIEIYTLDRLLNKDPVTGPDELLSWIFHGNREEVKIAKKLLSLLTKGEIPYGNMEEKISNLIWNPDDNEMLFLMKRHDYHKVLYVLEQVGFVEKRDMIWRMSKQLSTRIKAMLRQVEKLQT